MDLTLLRKEAAQEILHRVMEITGVTKPKRFAKNVAGDFYILDGCCVSCGVMHDVAPGLIAWHDFEPNESGYVSSHCFVARQPETPVEITQMIDAMKVMEFDCLQYGGDNPDLIAEIVQNGVAAQSDFLASPDDQSGS